MPGVPVVAGCLKSGGVRSGTDGVCGSLAAGSLLLQIPGGAPREPPFVGVSRVWTSTEGRMRSLPAPARAILAGLPACGPVLGGYSGGNWMVICVLPVRRGCRCGRALRVPFQSEATFTAAFGGFGN
ncbi:alpha/beta hydrolase fold family protein [Aspergillus niger]|uniref:Alpha/beta hydrolase fold family protein n=1 Tax=Aspergillus niger TaxID=5061 RepID=A0A505IF99_ASPNG|nr:alpha/beta hydrolase fold family protein [Aspergillus niger]